jgi:hypothetical protein
MDLSRKTITLTPYTPRLFCEHEFLLPEQAKCYINREKTIVERELVFTQY